MVYCWGYNRFDQLLLDQVGDGEKKSVVSNPLKWSLEEKAKEISGNWSCTFTLLGTLNHSLTL